VPFWDVDFDVVGEDFWDCLEVGLEVGVDADLECARGAYIPKKCPCIHTMVLCIRALHLTHGWRYPTLALTNQS